MRSVPTIELSFDPDQVPCTGLRKYLFWEDVEHLADHHPDPEVRAMGAELRAVDEPSGIDMHRFALAARRRMSKYDPGAWRVKRILDMVRRHSPLYTPRVCLCLRSARDRFVEQVELLLTALDRVGDVWTVARDGQVLADYTYLTTFGRLMSALGESTYRWQEASWHGVGYQVVADAAASTITVTITRGRVRSVATLRGLDPARSELARFLDHVPSDGKDVTIGRWLLTWPDAAVTTARRLQFRGPTFLSKAIPELLDAGLGSLDEDAQHLVVRLAQKWAGTPTELVHTAATAAAPAQ